jgi:hypothetical protein
MTKGLAYVFLRKDGAPLPPGCAGHVGWAFQLADDTFCAGATENLKGAPFVPPGHDNDAWVQVLATEAALVQHMTSLTLQGHQLGYDAYKVTTVRDCNPDAAEQAGNAIVHWGYTALGNNCLDHVWKVLAAYGVKDLPWAQTHPSPNDWFGVFNGEYHNL